jgi:hypothetical protein
MGAIEAVIINHNSSNYAEIALRALMADRDDPSPAIHTTVMDNHSTDDTSALRAAVAEFGAAFVLSRWPAGGSDRNTHGDVLRDFVLGRPDASAFLFVESDICFVRPGTVATMHRELCSAPDIWAVQAVLVSGSRPTAEQLRAVAVAQFRRKRRVRLRASLHHVGVEGPDLAKDLGMHTATIQPRCHPGCALIRNSPAFQETARRIGFSPSWSWSANRFVGGFSDTLALASQVMATHSQRFAYSQASVVHFWHGTRKPMDARRMRLLRELRAGSAVDREALALDA